MKLKRMIAAVITTVSVLSLTACGDNDNPISMIQDAVTSNVSSGNSANNGTPSIQDTTPSNVVSDGYDNGGTAGDGDLSEKPNPVALGIWDILPEIDVTDASAFTYYYEYSLGGMVVTNYLNKSPKVRIPDKLEGEPVVKVDFSDVNKDLTEIIMPDTVSDFIFSEKIQRTLEYANYPDEAQRGYGFKFSDCKRLKGLYMTKISDQAFRERTDLKSMEIPGCVIEIGNSAFSRCENLTSITIPDSVTSIRSDAFWGCTSLTSITIGSGVKLFDCYDFYNCSSLTSIEVSPDNTEYCSVDGVLFSKDMSVLIKCPAAKSGAYTIPDGVTGICGDAFHDCYFLTGITFPDSLREIADYAFNNCWLGEGTMITIPDSVTTIGEHAFWGQFDFNINYKGNIYSYYNIDELSAATKG